MLNHAPTKSLLALALGCALAGSVCAAPQQFFATAATATDSRMVDELRKFQEGTVDGVSEGFESFANGAIGSTAQSILGGQGTLTQASTGRGTVREGPPANGRSNTTPGACNATSTCKWLDTSTSFTVNLNVFRSAFGFFATDVGDAGASISLDLWDTVSNRSVRSGIAVTSPGQASSLLFFGWIDDAFTFNRITVNVAQTATNPGAFDGVGFDDVSTANRGTVSVPVSSPAPLGLTLLGLGLLGATTRRRLVASAK